MVKIPMFGSIGQEFPCLKGYINNFNVCKDSAKFTMFERIRARIPMFIKMGPEL